MRAEHGIPRKFPPPRRDFYSEAALKCQLVGGKEKLDGLSEEEVVRRVEGLAERTGEEIKWHEREVVSLVGRLDGIGIGIGSRKMGVREGLDGEYGGSEGARVKCLLGVDLVMLLGL
jgi:hypothetical protein